MVQTVAQWTFEVERGPGWLFVRPRIPETLSPDDDLADAVWAMLETEFVRRLVLEVDAFPTLNSRWIGQLIKLRKQLENCGGLLRLCGMSDANQEVLRRSRLDGQFPQYRTRHEAVLGTLPLKPR